MHSGCIIASLAGSYFCASSPGNPWLPVLPERKPWKIPDWSQLPSPCPALPPYRGVAQPTHAAGGRTEPHGSPLCAGPHGRLTLFQKTQIGREIHIIIIIQYFFLKTAYKWGIRDHNACASCAVCVHTGKRKCARPHKPMYTAIPYTWRAEREGIWCCPSPFLGEEQEWQLLVIIAFIDDNNNKTPTTWYLVRIWYSAAPASQKTRHLNVLGVGFGKGLDRISSASLSV